VYKERDGDMTLGGRIREIRKSRKVTQKEFSERICATQSYVSRLEADKAQPTDMLIKLIALEFQVSFHWLAYGEGELEISEAIFDYWDRTSTEELGEGAESGLVVFSRKLKEYNNASLYTGVSSIIGDISDVLDLYKNNIGFLTLLMEELWSICLAFTEMVKTLNTEAEKTRAIMNQTLIVKDKELLKSIRNESLSFLDTTRDSVKSIERLYLQWLKI
jgi:transcriptional regulator with XRE-family HTH domain